MRYLIILLLFAWLNISEAQNLVVRNAIIEEQGEELLYKKSVDSIVISTMMEGDTLEFSVRNSGDTIWLFSTPFIDNALLYNSNTMSFRKKIASLNFEFHVPHRESYYSGLNQYQFIRLLPFQSFTKRISLNRLVELSNKPKRKKAISEIHITATYFRNIEFISRREDSNEVVIRFDEDSFEKLETTILNK